MKPRKTIPWLTDRRSLLELTQRGGGGAGRMFVPTTEEVHSGELVSVEVGFEGFAQTFTIDGIVTAVRRHGRGASLPPGITVEVDPTQADRFAKVVRFAEGQQVDYSTRVHQRHPVRIEAVLRAADGDRPVVVQDVSLGGARISVEDGLPSMGEEISLVVQHGQGLFPLKLKGKVMWLCFFEAHRGLGVKFVGGGMGWKKKLERLVHEAGDPDPVPSE